VAGLRVIAKGAEADLILDPDWNGKRALIKRRGEKRYRHPQIDREIRRLRTLHEADIIHRAKEAGVPTPLIYQVDAGGASIVMEHVEGERVRDIVNTLGDDENRELFRIIGFEAGCLHGAGLIHGDLTTSNMIRVGNRVVFIDFGLGEISRETEKRGVDVNLMRRMLASTHFTRQVMLFDAFKEGYRNAMGPEADEVLVRVDEIARRGRYLEKE
jgi:TP53 regulating kinase-like protein